MAKAVGQPPRALIVVGDLEAGRVALDRYLPIMGKQRHVSRYNGFYTPGRYHRETIDPHLFVVGVDGSYGMCNIGDYLGCLAELDDTVDHAVACLTDDVIKADVTIAKIDKLAWCRPLLVIQCHGGDLSVYRSSEEWFARDV